MLQKGYGFLSKKILCARKSMCKIKDMPKSMRKESMPKSMIQKEKNERKQWALRCPPERKQWVPDTRQ
jgi:hypothetical protein